MLKLIKCEFWKLKRKHFVSFVVFAALLFPIPFTALVLAGSVGNFTGFDAARNIGRACHAAYRFRNCGGHAVFYGA